MPTEAELLEAIRALADIVRARGGESTADEDAAMRLLKGELYALRHPPPPPPPPPSVEQLRRRELLDKIQLEDLTLVELNELQRLLHGSFL